MPKTHQEIDALKENWVKDPCWDIETTEGFEDHSHELLAFRLEWEAKWKADADKRIKLTFDHRAQEILDCMEPGGVSNSHSFMAYQQIKAILLLAERVNQLVEIMNSRPA